MRNILQNEVHVRTISIYNRESRDCCRRYLIFFFFPLRTMFSKARKVGRYDFSKHRNFSYTCTLESWSVSHVSSRANGFQIRRHDFPSKSRAHLRLLREIECRMHSRRERGIPGTHMMRICFFFIGIFIPFRADDFACTKDPNHISPDLLKARVSFQHAGSAL